MIKFFRQIRFKLMETGKTGKYFKYAIGEIVLVVIGILIALQINNAKEKRRDRFQEITILKNIQEDILLDTLDIGFNIEFHNAYIKDEKRLLKFLQSNLDQPTEAIDYTSALSVPLTIALHTATFKNLQNNQIGIITNNRLKKDISRFYDFFAQAIQKLENDNPAYETYNDKKVYFKKYFRLSQESYILNNEPSNNDDYYNPDLDKQSLEFKDIMGAKNDEAFKIELNESIFIRQIKIDFYTDMLARIKELNLEIDQELKELSN